MSVDLALSYARLALSGGVVALGLALMLGGAIGFVRFPDFYTRLHAVNAGDGVGGAIVLLGLMIAAPTQALALRMLVLTVLFAAASPVLAQLTANAAHAGGLAPIAGPYPPPRSGTREPTA